MNIIERWQRLDAKFEKLPAVAFKGTIQDDTINACNAYAMFGGAAGAEFDHLAESAGKLLSQTPGLDPGVDFDHYEIPSHLWFAFLIARGLHLRCHTIPVTLKLAKSDGSGTAYATSADINPAERASVAAIGWIIDRLADSGGEPDADTSKNTEKRPFAQKSLDQLLADEYVKGGERRAINHDFFMKRWKKMGKTKSEAKTQFETIKRNARRAVDRMK